YFLLDLDVGAVERADGQGTVHGELHVAGARRLRAGRRDLFAQVGGGDDDLGQRHAIIGHEHHLHQSAGAGVVVDDGGDVVDEANDLLGGEVTGRGLAGDDVDVRLRRTFAVLHEAEIVVHDVQHVQQLPLVLVDALDLHIVNGVGGKGHAGRVADDEA